MSKLEDLLVNKGLYDSVEICIDDLDELEKLLSGSSYNGYNINCFCANCNEIRTFETVDKTIHNESGFARIDFFNDYYDPSIQEIFNDYLNKRYSLSFRCTRNHKHSILFDLLVTNNKIIKIGQYPSFADLANRDISRYKSVLGNKFNEYSKSLGLFSHGIGIGSFVYLRRIIESLIFDKYDEVKESLNISHDDFMKSEFKDKIDILKNYLPSVLVKNKNIYSIISKGIHHLNEEECSSIYPVIKDGIELILDDLIAEKQRIEKEKKFSIHIANITGELKNKK